MKIEDLAKELDAEGQEALRRLQDMDKSDILHMDSHLLWKLAGGFRNPNLVRLIVDKGQDKYWREEIFLKLKNAYQFEYSRLDFSEKIYMRDLGNDCGSAWYFEDIAYDIATNQPMLSIDDEDEEKPQQECPPTELQAELEELREQVEHFRNKEKGTALGLNQGQAALFGLALANTFDFNYTNKKEELAPMLHKLFGWGQAKLKSCLSTPCDKAERDELAYLFKELCPPLYKTIMNWGELPQ